MVDTAEAQRRPVDTALAGVVVDDIENDLDTGLVQRRHHGLEFVDLLAGGSDRTVGAVRCEEAERRVTPIVGLAARGNGRLADEVVHRQQLDGRDT